MTRRLKEVLARRAAACLVGRDTELDELVRALDATPSVVFVHGIPGIGKTSLVDAFAVAARGMGGSVIALDGRTIEPTERGFLVGLSEAMGEELRSVVRATERLGALGDHVALVIDQYEVLRLLDSWVRRELVPQLPQHAALVLAGRDAPVHAWLTTPGFHEIFRSLALAPLSNADCLRWLADSGLDDESARRLKRIAQGHPLALALGIAVGRSGGTLRLDTIAEHRVVLELTRLFMAAVPDAKTEELLEAASVVRRTTIPLLKVMLPEVGPKDGLDRLAALPFVESTPEGLYVQEAVQSVVARSLRANDPGRYRELKRAAWTQLSREAREVSGEALWRYTADLLFVLDNPVLHDAFFPSEAHTIAVEPARPGDGEPILEIARQHDGDAGRAAIALWWTRSPGAFLVARGSEGEVEGFYCLVDGEDADPGDAEADPVVAGYLAHLQASPTEAWERVLFCRRWLARETGEAPSPHQAAFWLDIKRAYMELRPKLRRVYTSVRDVDTYWPVVERLGFRPLPGEAVELGGHRYVSCVLDMGPSSVDGWLSGLVARELGLEPRGEVLDLDARELVLNGSRVALTPLEFGVAKYLVEREGKAVSRAELLERVWGYRYTGGSNVVDVVVRSLRKKLRPHAKWIHTVPKVGYRFRREAARDPGEAEPV